MKWISVKDRLPTKKQAKEEDFFLVLLEKQPRYLNRSPWRGVELAEFFPEQERCIEDDFPGTEPYWDVVDGQHGEFIITHWAIVPKFPKIQEGDK